jgi:hypothetical protein
VVLNWGNQPVLNEEILQDEVGRRRILTFAYCEFVRLESASDGAKVGEQ